jgi:hypothetical protein
LKRSQIVLVTVVFTALLTGILMERARRVDPFGEQPLGPPLSVPLEPLAAPRGEHRLAGRVEADDAASAAGVLVRLTALEPGTEERPLSWTVTDAEGRFALEELYAGAYRATLLQVGREVERFEVRVPLEGEVRWRVGAPRPELESLPELRRETVAGRAHDGRGDPLAGLEVVVRPAASAEPLSGALVRRARTDAEGRFAFDGLVVADHVVELLPEWASGGSWPVLCSIELSASEVSPAQPLELVFEPAAILGRLRDVHDRPIEGALVQLWPASAPERVWPTVQSDADGVFRLERLPAGTFVLHVRAGRAGLEAELDLAAGEARELDLAPLDP